MRRPVVRLMLILPIALVGCGGNSLPNLGAQFQKMWSPCSGITIGQPAWSPDGQTLAYTISGQATNALYLTDMSTGMTTKLADVVTDPIAPEWSPDGASMLFGTVIAHDIDYGAEYQLFYVDLDGSKHIVSEQLWGQLDSHKWSPDGTKIAASYYGPVELTSDLVVLSVDGEIIWQLSQIYHEDLLVSLGDWSPDGTHLALRLTSGAENFLAIVGASGDDLKIFSPHPIDYGSIQWSPDGTHIAFTTHKINSSNIALNIVHFDGTDLRVLANDLAGQFAWLPDSKGIIYVRLNGEVVTISTDGSSQSTLTTIPVGFNYQDFSPDGTMIAYTNPGRYGAYDLFVRNIDGSNLRNLTHNPGNQMCLHWPF